MPLVSWSPSTLQAGGLSTGERLAHREVRTRAGPGVPIPEPSSALLGPVALCSQPLGWVHGPGLLSCHPVTSCGREAKPQGAAGVGGRGSGEGSAHTCEEVDPGFRGLLASTPFHVQALASLACPSSPEAARLCSQPTCPQLSSRESPSTSWGGRHGLQGQRPTVQTKNRAGRGWLPPLPPTPSNLGVYGTSC